MDGKRAPFPLDDAVLPFDRRVIDAPFAIRAAANPKWRFIHEPMLAGEAVEEDEFGG